MFLYTILISITIAYILNNARYLAVDVTAWPNFAPQPINSIPLAPSAYSIHKKISGGGPETVIVHSGYSYMLCENGDVKRMDNSDNRSPPTTVARVGGRPLGGAIAQLECTKTHDVLYLAEASKGLLRVTILKPEASSKSTHQSSTVEIVSFELSDGTPILYADDVAVGVKTGRVYFTDASDVVVERVKGSKTKFNTLSASIIDGVRGERTGKLLMYDPKTRETEVVASGIWFANGVGVDKNEDYALVCETFAARVLKVWLKGKRKGEVEVFADGVFTGYIDGLSINHDTGRVHVAVPSPSPPVIHLLSKIQPVFLNTFLRNIILLLPPFIKPVRYGCFVTLNLEGEVINTWIDEKGRIANFVTAVEERDGKAYLGSLKEDKVVVVDLE